MQLRWTQYGRDALLIRFADRPGDDAMRASAALLSELERRPPAGLVELVPAFTTILLEFAPGSIPDMSAQATNIVTRLGAAARREIPLPAPKEIPVRYDGEDLDRVAALHEITTAEVVRLHAAPLYTVCMLGFSPGFPYLGPLDHRLHTPRLAAPRPRVPAGSVAIGGEHTGIYSVETPGGWNIIGSTQAKLFDPSQPDDAMFLLAAGDRVQFVPQPA